MFTGNRFSVILIALALMLPLGLAAQGLSVTVEPLSADANAPIYTFETRFYKATIENVSGEELRAVQLAIKPDDALAVLVDSEERRERFYTILRLEPDSAEEKVFEVKGLARETREAELGFEFGVRDLNNSDSIIMLVVPSPLVTESRLEDDDLGPGESSRVLFSLSNASQEPLRNISAELFSNNAVLPTTPPFELAQLSPGESSGVQSLGFSVTEAARNQVFLMRIFFEDSSGMHVLEKQFLLRNDNLALNLAIIIALVLLLVIMHFYRGELAAIFREKGGRGKIGEESEEDKKGKWAAK